MSPLQARLTIVDPLFADGGPFGPDRQWPPLIPQFAEISNTPPDTLTTALSPLYGEKSDEGAIDPVTHVQVSKGLVPGVLLGQTVIDSSPVPGAPEQDLSIPAPVIDSQNNVGPPPPGYADGFHNTIYSYLAAKRVSDGKIGTLAAQWTLDPDPAEWANADPAGVVVATNFYFIDAGTGAYTYIQWSSTDPAYHPITNPTTTAQLGVGTHDGITYDAVFDVDRDMFAGDSRMYTGPQTQPTVDVWDVYLFAWGAIYRGISLFGSDLGNAVADQKHDRVRLDVDAINGSSILWPWAADGSIAAVWPYSDPFVDLTATDGTTYRLTVLFARGPISDDHKNGVVNFTANLIGIEDVGDATGLPIMEVHPAEQHWIENFILNRYTSGLWATSGTAPKWADGTYKVRSSTFTARQAYSTAALGGAGLLVSWYPDTAKGVLEHVREWNFSTETKLGVNGHGQLTLGYLDERNDPATWPRVQHIRDIFGPVTSAFGENRENVVHGDCDYDPDSSKFRTQLIEFKSTVGYAKYKNRWKAGDILHSTILGRSEHFEWVLKKRLDRLATGEINVSIQGPTGWLDTDVDAPGIQLTSIEGRGASGYVAAPMWLRRRRWSLSSRLTTYSLQDVGDIQLGVRFRAVADQQIRIIDTLSARLNPQPISATTETLHVTESLSLRLNPQPIAVTTDHLRIIDSAIGVVV